MLLAAGIAYFLDAAILLLFGEKQRGDPKNRQRGLHLGQSDPTWDRILVAGFAILFIVAFYPDDAVHQAVGSGDARAGAGPRRSS